MADSYADRVRREVAHAPVQPTISEDRRGVEQQLRREAVEPELLAAFSNAGRNDPIHPTRARVGEVLPPGFTRSAVGLLLCNNVKEVRVNQETIRAAMSNLQHHSSIAYFVGGRQSSDTLRQWIASVQTQINESVTIGRDLGRGFFQIRTSSLVATQKVLMLTPHHSKWGTCIIQAWTPRFNPNSPVGMRTPTWVTLKEVPGELLGVAPEIAGGLGDLLGVDRNNEFSTDQRFCVALSTEGGWQMQVGVRNETTGELSVINIDYGHLPIRCRSCLSTDHLVRNCPSLQNPRDQARGLDVSSDTSSQVRIGLQPPEGRRHVLANSGSQTIRPTDPVCTSGQGRENISRQAPKTAQERTSIRSGMRGDNSVPGPEVEMNTDPAPEVKELPLAPLGMQQKVINVINSTSSSQTRGESSSSTSGSGYPRPAGATDSCWTEVPCRDGFRNVTRSDINEGFEQVR